MIEILYDQSHHFIMI